MRITIYTTDLSYDEITRPAPRESTVDGDRLDELRMKNVSFQKRCSIVVGDDRDTLFVSPSAAPTQAQASEAMAQAFPSGMKRVLVGVKKERVSEPLSIIRDMAALPYTTEEAALEVREVDPVDDEDTSSKNTGDLPPLHPASAQSVRRWEGWSRWRSNWLEKPLLVWA